MLTALAAEQEAGRLRIRPAVLIPGGETLTVVSTGSRRGPHAAAAQVS
jgi:hypothetical protein